MSKERPIAPVITAITAIAAFCVAALSLLTAQSAHRTADEQRAIAEEALALAKAQDQRSNYVTIFPTLTERCVVSFHTTDNDVILNSVTLESAVSTGAMWEPDAGPPLTTIFPESDLTPLAMAHYDPGGDSLVAESRMALVARYDFSRHGAAHQEVRLLRITALYSIHPDTLKVRAIACQSITQDPTNFTNDAEALQTTIRQAGYGRGEFNPSQFELSNFQPYMARFIEPEGLDH